MKQTLLAFALIFLFAPQANALHEGDELSIVYADNWSPFSNGSGHDVAGILPSLAQEIIGNRMGYKIHHFAVPWKRAGQLVKSGKADAFITTPTASRLRFTRSSRNSIFSLNYRAFVSKAGFLTSNEKELSTEQLRDLKVCDVLGNGWVETFYKPNAIPFSTVKDVEVCLNLINMNRQDVLIHPAAVAWRALDRMGLTSQFLMLPGRYPSPDFTLMISRSSKFDESFLNEFDQVVDTMKQSGEFDALMERLILGEKNDP